MYKLTSSNTTYIVPLEGLDLHSLNRNYDRGVKPLWKVPSGDDYYEFKLNAWRIAEESDDEEITDLEFESQICHICNTNVPTIYIKAHNNSTQHINMKKIHDLFIHRGRNPDLNSSEEHCLSETSYYCEECSMVVLISNRQSHETSYIHKKSLRNKDLIEQFLKFYSQNLNEDILKPPMQGYFNKFLNKKNLSFKVDVFDNENIIIIIDEYKVKINNYNFHGFVKMDHELICILCEIQLKRNAIEPHIESKKHRKKVVRNMDNEHCIREINEDFVHCLLCNELVLVSRVAGHRVVSYHTRNLNKALGRKSMDFNENDAKCKANGVFGNLSDELQSDDGETDDGSEVDDQFKSDYENDSRGYVNNEDNTLDINKIYCDVCSIYIDTHNLMNHKLGSTHKQVELEKMNTEVKYLQKVKDNYKNTELNVDDTSEENVLAISSDINEGELLRTTKDESLSIHHHMEESSYNIVSCRVCNIKMYIEDINSHIDQDFHVTKYENLLKINNIIKKNDFVCFCKVCDHPIFVKSVLDHVFSETHRTKISNTGTEETCLKTVNKNLHPLENDNDCVKDFYCQVCNIKMCNEDMDEHINQDYHVIKYENLLKVNKIIKNNYFVCFCQVCQHPVFVKSLLDHINSVQHRTIINNDDGNNKINNRSVDDNNESKQDENANFHLKTETNNEFDNITQENAEDIQQDVTQNQIDTEITDIPTDFLDKINYQILDTVNDNVITCKVCNTQISNNDLDIFRHFDSEDHAAKYNDLLKVNRLTKAQNKFFCYACKTSITSKNELEHIFGNKHKSKFPNHDIDAACKISCQINEGKISVTVQSTNAHDKDPTQTENNTKKSPVKAKSNSVSKTKNDLNATIENGQAVFLKEYYLVAKTKNPSKVVCKVCHVILTNTIINIENHIMGSDHINMYEYLLKTNKVTKRKTGFYCEACEVYLSNKNEWIHISGMKHTTRLLEFAVTCLKARYEQETDEAIEEKGTKENIDNPEAQSCPEVSDNNTIQKNIDQTESTSNNHMKALKDLDGHAEANNLISYINAGPSNDDIQTPNDSSIKDETIDLTCEIEASISNDSIEASNYLHGGEVAIQKSDIIAGVSNDDNQEPKEETTYQRDDIHAAASNNIQTTNDSQIDNTPIVESQNNVENSGDGNEFSSETINFQATFSKPYHHVTKTANPAEVLCKICNVSLTNSTVNIETHIMGFNHTNKYKILINSNGLRKENDRFFCEICNVFISNKNEVEHIAGFKHNARLPKNGDCDHIVCDICNARIPSYYMEKHLTSPEHFMYEFMKETQAKLDGLVKEMQRMREESNALRSRTNRLAYQQGRR